MAIGEETLLEARLRYNAAFSAFQSCERLVSNAPCAELLELEAYALRALTEARAKLLAAIADLHNANLVRTLKQDRSQTASNDYALPATSTRTMES